MTAGRRQTTRARHQWRCVCAGGVDDGRWGGHQTRCTGAEERHAQEEAVAPPTHCCVGPGLQRANPFVVRHHDKAVIPARAMPARLGGLLCLSRSTRMVPLCRCILSSLSTWHTVLGTRGGRKPNCKRVSSRRRRATGRKNAPQRGCCPYWCQRVVNPAERGHFVARGRCTGTNGDPVPRVQR